MAISKAGLEALKRLAQLRPEAERSALLEKLYVQKFGSVPLNDPLSKEVPTIQDWIKTLPDNFDPAVELKKFKKGGLAQMKECTCGR